MPPLVIPGAVQVTVIWQSSAIDYAVNVHHFANLGAIAINQALAESVDGIYKNAFTSSGLEDWIASSVRHDRTGVRNIAVANDPVFFSTAPPAFGLAVTDLLPLAASLVVTLRTGKAGRSFRGRHYQPGFAEAANTAAGQAAAAAQTAAQDYLGAISSVMAGTHGLALGVASRKLSLITLSTEQEVRDATWDTQRRRAVPGI